MASWNFRRGLCLFQLKRQMDLAATRNLTTTVKRLGGGYVVHGGEACKTPTKVDIGNREVKSVKYLDFKARLGSFRTF